MRRKLIIVAIALLFTLTVPVVFVYWLCYSESGLHWLAARTASLRTVQIHIEGLHGTLATSVDATRLEITHERMHLVATGVHVRVRLRSLLLQTIDVRRLKAATVKLELKPRVKPPTSTPMRFLPGWLRIRGRSITLGGTQVVLLNGTVLEAQRIHTRLALESQSLSLDRLSLVSTQLSAGGKFRLEARDPVGMGANLAWSWRMPDQPQWSGRATVSGDLNRLEATARVEKPLVADVNGALLDLTTRWHWQAKAHVPDFTLEPWSPASRVRVTAIDLTGQGDRDHIELTGPFTPVMPDLGTVDLAFGGAFAERTLRADTLVLRTRANGGVIAAKGTAKFAGGPPVLDLRGTWTRSGWPFKPPAVVLSDHGEFELRGPIPYEYVVRADVRAPHLSKSQVEAKGHLGKDSITADALHGTGPQGEIDAGGELVFASERWKVTADAQRINPAQIHEAFPGAVSFRVAAAGRGYDKDAEIEANVTRLRGTVRGQPLSGHAQIQRDTRNIRIGDTSVQWGEARFEAEGDYGEHNNLIWRLFVPNLAQLMPDARGALRSNGTVTGTIEEPGVVGAVSAHDLEFSTYRLGKFEAEANVDVHDRRSSRVLLSGSELWFGEREVRSVELVAEGHRPQHTLSIKADAENARLSLRTESGYANGTWSGTINLLDVGLGGTQLRLAAPATYSTSKELFSLSELCLTGGEGRACAHGEWHVNGPWNLAAEGSGLPLRFLAAGLPKESEYSGMLSFKAAATSHPDSRWTGNGQVTLGDGVFRYKRANGKIEDVHLGDGQVNVDALADKFSATASMRATELTGVQLQAAADRTVSADWHAFPLTGSLSAQTRELGFLPVVFPDVDRAQGQLDAKVTLGGTLGQPEINGRLDLADGQMDFYVINLQLREIAARVDLQGNTLKLTASARAGKGTARLNGDLAWRDRKPYGTLKLKGDNLSMVNVPEGRVNMSPDLRFAIEDRSIKTTGSIFIPSAYLAPADLTGAVLPSSDEVIVGEQILDEEQRWNVTTDIQLKLGDDVLVDTYGLKARIEGSVQASSETGKPSTAVGELKIAEGGNYSAYTRQFDIERGRLVFSGGLITDPGVDLRASKQFPEARAGINVRGTLRDPRLTFWSDPPLPQSQVVSLILTGGELDTYQTNRANGASSGPSAGTNELLAQGGALLASQLTQQLGIKLEEVRVESDTNDQARLVLGRYLSPRFYVSFGISLSEALNTLKMRYTINDKWTISGEAGENRSADLEFKIEH